MCGIVGILSPVVPVETKLLCELRDRLRHRGPDACGEWMSPKRKVAFGHRRLSIVDCSEGSNQPMVSACNQYVLVFNGEIYNFIELKEELSKLGHKFRTSGDTEVLLTALIEWGEGALSRLNGMFSLIFYDRLQKRLLVARDRFGEKPLFIGFGDLSTVVIASEMKAITAHPLIDLTIDDQSITAYAKGDWYENDERTFFVNIKRFPAATARWLSVEGRNIKEWKYWTPDYSVVRDVDAVSDLKAKLEKSVAMRLRSDVPVGSSLSGGLDSSVIVGIIANQNESNINTQHTFSACFPDDADISEENEIDAVQEFTHVNSLKVSPNPEGLKKDSLMLHWHQEEPFLSASIYLQWCVARLAKENNVTVLLDGQGADELLAGYQYYFKTRQLDLIDQGYFDVAMKETQAFNGRLISASEGDEKPERRFNAQVAFSNEEIASLIQKKKARGGSKDQKALGAENSDLRRILFDAVTYNSLPMLLRYADRNSMAFSREARLPFLDYEFADLCMSLPDDAYIRDGWQKRILRECAAGIVPESIRWRVDKVGYAAPLDHWMRGELKDWCFERITDDRLSGIDGYYQDEVLKLWEEHLGGRKNNSWALWKWISLVEWFELNDRGWWRSGGPAALADS